MVTFYVMFVIPQELLLSILFLKKLVGTICLKERFNSKVKNLATSVLYI